jgi:hypothetical protein
MSSRARSVLMLATGAVVIFVHDFAYRRVDSGVGQYELGGIISHAGADMVILTVILAAVCLIADRMDGHDASR